MPIPDIAIAVLTMVLWGMNFGFAKWGLSELPPLLFMSMRFLVVALLLVPFVPMPRGKFRGIAALSVTLGLLHFSMMFTGLTVIDASTAAIAIQLQVPFAAILAAIFFRETLGWRRALGLVLAFAGVVVIAGAPTLGEGALPYLLLIVVASFMWAISNVIIKRMGPVNAFQLNGWMALLTVPQLVLASLLLETGQAEAVANIGWKGVVGIAYNSVVVVIIGYALWYSLLKRYSVNQTMPFTLLLPFFGVLSGVLMIGERLTVETLIGGLLTVAGIAVIVLRRPRAVETPAGSAT